MHTTRGVCLFIIILYMYIIRAYYIMHTTSVASICIILFIVQYVSYVCQAWLCILASTFGPYLI